MKITDVLLELGFEKTDYRGEEAYLKRCNGGRFEYDFVFYEDDSTFYINKHGMSGTNTVSEKEVLADHNSLNTKAKEEWLKIKEAVKDYQYSVYNG